MILVDTEHIYPFSSSDFGLVTDIIDKFSSKKTAAKINTFLAKSTRIYTKTLNRNVFLGTFIKSSYKFFLGYSHNLSPLPTNKIVSELRQTHKVNRLQRRINPLRDEN